MSSGGMETPELSELAGLPIELRRGGEPWVTSVVARSSNGDEVRFTWDEIAAAVHVRWDSGSLCLLTLERESIAKVSVRQRGDEVLLEAVMRESDLEGTTVVVVGDRIAVTDSVLRV
ncbi:hypothetical protein GCM10009857_06500 [Agromyces soli]